MTTPRPKTIDIALLLLIFLLPSSFQVVPPAIPFGHFYISLVEICIFILLAHWVFHFLSCGKGYRSPPDSYFLALLAYLFMSLVLGIRQSGAINALGDFRQYLPLFLYFWALRFFSYAPDMYKIRQCIFNIMIVVAIYIMILFLFFRDKLADSEVMTNRVFFDNTLFLLMCYGGYLLSRSILTNKQRGYTFSFLALNGLMLLAMQARSYWVAFAIVIGTVALQQRKIFFKSRFVVSVTFMFVFMISLMNLVPAELMGLQGVSASINDRLHSLINFEQTFFELENTGSTETETLGTRIMTAEVIWNEYVLESPLFGTGFGGELPMVSRLGGIGLMKYSVDNGYLTILAKFGALGLTLYGLIIWHIGTALFRIAKSPFANNDEKLLARSFLTGIFATLLASFFTSIFVRQQPSLVAFLFVVAETEVMRQNVETKQMNIRQTVNFALGRA